MCPVYFFILMQCFEKLKFCQFHNICNFPHKKIIKIDIQNILLISIHSYLLFNYTSSFASKYHVKVGGNVV